MERRVLLAIFLAFIVLYTWQALFVKPAPKPIAGTTASSSAPAVAASAASAAGGMSQPETPGVGAASSAPLAAALVADTVEHDVRVETRDVIAVFTNKGARLKSWRLKRYLDQQKQPQELIEHLPSQPLPFTLRAANDTTTATLNGGLYTVTGVPASTVDSAPADLRFEYRDSAGIHAIKEFHLEPSSYIFSFRATVTENDTPIMPAILWGPGIGDITEISRGVKKAEGILFQGGKVVRLAPKDIAKQASYDGDFHYTGVDDNYFMVAAVFPEPLKVSFAPVSVPPPDGSKDAARDLTAFSLEPHTGAPLKFFAGPKDFDVLSAIDRDLARAIDFGMFTVIVVPLLRSLKWVNSYVGNYGWAIILLTFFINVILFPLRHKSVVSMRKMQEIQPQVKAIQERYKNLKATDPDKQKMNTEMMALYKEKGVNPASGCVPMLLTMPFIFAFYALLSTAIELRGAPFILWIHDLSAHDPYFVTPVLMGVSQVWQQRLAPAAGMDPIQQKMTMLMPIFFTFLFLWYPSGVALYWLINNVFAIGQQYATNYMIGPPKIAAAAGAGGSASERRMKRVGGGKTDAAARENQ
ncbi:MAG: yidC [Acidobacteria bacterium]|nr:yidC [Acidobacteriota bacterium]